MVGEGQKTEEAGRQGIKMKLKRTDLEKIYQKNNGKKCECGVEEKLGSDT